MLQRSQSARTCAEHLATVQFGGGPSVQSESVSLSVDNFINLLRMLGNTTVCHADCGVSHECPWSLGLFPGCEMWTPGLGVHLESTLLH